MTPLEAKQLVYALKRDYHGMILAYHRKDGMATDRLFARMETTQEKIIQAMTERNLQDDPS